MTNPLRGLRFSLLDFHSARANAGMKIAMLGIALIPLIYGALYLMAFYDPYGSLDTLPVAVVNEDVPVTTADGKTVHAGDDLVDELTESESLEYHVVDADEAQRGLEAGTYYNKIVIPSDFSEKVASADGDAPQQARLVLVANEANNYLSSILGASVMRQVTAETNYAIGDNYYVEIFDKIEDTGDSIKVAADGATELADGLGDATDGAGTIADKLGEAKDGSATLAEGLQDAASGSGKVTDGLGSAREGAHQLAEGAVSAADGSTAITLGLDEAHEGAGTLADGVKTAAKGSGSITKGLGTASEGATSLDEGLGDLSAGLDSASQGANALDTGIHSLKDGAGQLATGSAALKSQIEAQHDSLVALDEGTGAFVDKLQGMEPGIKELGQGLGGVSAKLQGIATQKEALVSGADALIAKGDDAAQRAAAVQEQLSGVEPAITQGMGGAQKKLEGCGADITAAGGDLKSAGEGLAGLGTDLQTAGQRAGAAKEAAAQGKVTLSGLQAGDALTQDQIDALTSALGQAESGADDALAAIQGASQKTGSVADAVSSAGGHVSDAGTDLNGAGDSLTGVGTTLSGLTNLTKSEDVQAMMDDLDAIKTSMPQVKTGIEQLLKSSDEVLSEAGGAMAKAQALVPSSDELQQLAALKAGTHSVVGTLATAGDGKNPTIYGSVCAIANGAGQLSAGANDAADGADTLAGGLAQLAAGAKTAKEGSSSLSEGLGTLHAGSKQLTSGLGSAKTGAAALKKGLGTLYAGSETLTRGLGDAKSGSAALAQGLDQLQVGSQTLTDGLVSARDGSETLTDGLGQLEDGAGTLADGLVEARDGSHELADGLSDGVGKVAEATENADGRAEMMSEPVRLEQEYYTSVANYGSGFAPYFIALGLWVGSLVMTFLFKPLNNRLIMSGASPVVTAFDGLVPWLLVGLVQSLLLGATIQFACGIQVDHPLAYYALIALSSAVFCAMVQAITTVFGFPGKFVAVVLLMLQLTTAAGTFPIETEFKVFQDLSPYLPMTYVVRALRQAMRGVDLSLVAPSVWALVAFALGAFAVTCLSARRKRFVTMMDLHPLVDL